MHLGAIHRLRTYGFHPGLTQFLTNYVMRFSSSQCPRRSAAGDAAQRAVHGPKGSALPRGLEPGSLRFRDDHLHIDLTGARSPEPSLVLLRRFWFWFWVWFLLPMKIENRLLIGRDFFADWLSSLSTFSRTEKSSLAASQPPRVSSTIKPRCDAAPVPHTPHTSTSIPAHARSSDLRQHQVSLVSINTRARFGARVAARPRDSGDRSGRCFSPQKGPVYRGSPPPRSTRLARSIVDAENIDASIRPMTSQSTKFTGSERVYILGAVPTTALSGALDRENHRTSSADSHSPLHLFPIAAETTPNLSTMPSPQNVYTALSIISLGGLIGMGVAVGSGVSMMAMAMAEEEQKMVAPSVVEKPSTARGFAASVTERR